MLDSLHEGPYEKRASYYSHRISDQCLSISRMRASSRRISLVEFFEIISSRSWNGVDSSIIQTYLQVTQPVLTRLTRFVSGMAEGEVSATPSVFSLLALDDGIVQMMYRNQC